MMVLNYRRQNSRPISYSAPSPPFSFMLPPELVAKEPPERRGILRDEVKLMVINRSNFETKILCCSHGNFKLNFYQYLFLISITSTANDKTLVLIYKQ
jgi:hypothetical protein